MRSFQACPKENEKYLIVSQSTNVVRLKQGLCKVACLTVCEIEAGPFVMGDTAETVLHSLGLQTGEGGGQLPQAVLQPPPFPSVSCSWVSLGQELGGSHLCLGYLFPSLSNPRQWQGRGSRTKKRQHSATQEDE